MSISSAPQLSDQARLVLQIILDRIIVRGVDIMSLASISQPNDLLTVVKELTSQKLIEFKGELTEERAPLATFTALPSKQSYLRTLT